MQAPPTPALLVKRQNKLHKAISFNALMYSCVHIDVHVQYICADMHKYAQTAHTPLLDPLLEAKIVHFCLS